MKTKSIKVSGYILFAILLFSVNLFAQDFEGILEYETLKGDKKGESQKIYLTSDKMRMDDPERRMSMVIRLDDEVMLNINHKNKTYNEIPFAQIQQGMEQAQSAMKEAMDKMTPEQREMMKKMGVKIPGMDVAEKEKAFELTKTGEKAKINGYNAEKYLFKSSLQDKETEMWVSKDLGSAKNFGKIMSSMMESMGVDKLLGGMAAFTKLDGIPVKSVEDDEVRLLKNVTKGGLKSSDFAAPSGYKKKDIKMGG